MSAAAVGGGRFGYDHFSSWTASRPGVWPCAKRHARRWSTSEAIDVPAGTAHAGGASGAGWPGVLPHEAGGSGLEGTSTARLLRLCRCASASRWLPNTAPSSMTAPAGSARLRAPIDAGTPGLQRADRERHSWRYLQDKQNACLMGCCSPATGCRESYAALPMPRMTNNLHMLAGQYDPAGDHRPGEEGDLCPNFGGQVDITWQSSASEAYLIEDGKDHLRPSWRPL